jgi:Protein of unknown function (DUF2568)
MIEPFARRLEAVVEHPATCWSGGRGGVRDSAAMRAANLALKFLVELAAFAAFAVWGAAAGDGIWSVVLGIAAPAVAIVLWAIFAAPKSERRLGGAARVPFELGVFGLAAVGLAVADHVTLAIVFAVVAAVNAALLFAFGQWEQ